VLGSLVETSSHMRAILLGTGAPPPNPARRGPATLLAHGEERFLVDAGSGVGAQLVRAGLRPFDWPRIFITHHHSDHTIDLGHLLITRWIVGQNAPLEVFGPAGTRSQIEKLLDYLDWDIEVRRRHMHDRRPPTVRVIEIEEGKLLEAGGVTVSAFLVEHDPVRPAFGFRFDFRTLGLEGAYGLLERGQAGAGSRALGTVLARAIARRVPGIVGLKESAARLGFRDRRAVSRTNGQIYAAWGLANTAEDEKTARARATLIYNTGRMIVWDETGTSLVRDARGDWTPLYN